MRRRSALMLLLALGSPLAAQAQACVPNPSFDWMAEILLDRQSALYFPGAAAVRPGDCQQVEQSPPDFSWPHLSGAARYQVSLTSPDGRTRTRATRRNWINWDEVLPSGDYAWRVQPEDMDGNPLGAASLQRRFTVGAGAVPFVVPEMTRLVHRLGHRSHPRALPDGFTLARMASQRAAALEKLRERVNGDLNESPPGAGAQGDGYVYGDKALRSLMAYVYDRTGYYKQDAKQRVLNLASWDPRGPTAIDDEESRFVAWVVTLGYDWLGRGLNPRERYRMLSMLNGRIGDLYGWITAAHGWPPDSSFVPLPLWQQTRDSHRQVAAGMLAAMSTLLVGDLPAARTWLQEVLPLALNMTSPWSGEEGGYANGTAYSLSDTGAMLSAWYALRRATCDRRQTCIDLAQKAWVRNYGRFLAYFLPPTAGARGPGTPIGLFGDGFAEAQLFEQRARYAKGYVHFAPSALGCWYASKLAGEDPTRIEYLMSPPNACGSSAFPSAAPNSLYLPSIGWVAMHSDLADPERTSVYFKSSPAPFGAYNHQSADQNAFVLNAGGERLAIESGYYGDYDGYATAHWQWWVKRTRSKNAVTFDGGRGQIAYEHLPHPFQLANFRYGSITQQLSTADYDIVTGDATDAYDGALTRAVRSLVYLRPGTVLVYDSLASGTPRRWEWNIHALDPIREIDGGRGIQIVQGAQSLCVDVLAGQGETFMPINAAGFGSWGTADDGVASAAPLDPGAPVQFHGKFASAQPSSALELIALLRVGCVPVTASASNTNGIWSVRVGERVVTIGAGGIGVQ